MSGWSDSLVQWGLDMAVKEGGSWQVQDCGCDANNRVTAGLCLTGHHHHSLHWLTGHTTTTTITPHCCSPVILQYNMYYNILQYQTITTIMVGQVAPVLMIHHSLTSVTRQAWCLSASASQSWCWALGLYIPLFATFSCQTSWCLEFLCFVCRSARRLSRKTRQSEFYLKPEATSWSWRTYRTCRL